MKTKSPKHKVQCGGGNWIIYSDMEDGTDHSKFYSDPMYDRL